MDTKKFVMIALPYLVAAATAAAMVAQKSPSPTVALVGTCIVAVLAHVNYHQDPGAS